jgi:hypothetical protein
MDANKDRQATPSFVISVTLLYALALMTLLVATAPRHGPWFDEFWTRFLSDPSIALDNAFLNRWVEDVHPPLFSFLARVSSKVWRLPIEQARLLNLIPAAFTVAYLATIARLVPRERPFLAVLAISVGASPFFVEYIAEFRSYFTGMCAFLALTATLVAQDRLTQEDGVTTKTGLWLGYVASLAVCLNIHYLTTAMTAVMVAVFGLAAAYRKDWHRFWTYLASGTLLCLPFIAFVAYQYTTIERISADYWLKTAMLPALEMLMGALLVPISGARTAVMVVWLAAAILIIRQTSPRRPDRTIAPLAIAIAAEILLLLVYTRLTAAMTERYLIPLSILAAALISILLCRKIYASRLLLALFAATNFAAAVVAAVPRWSDLRWDEAAIYLAERQHACPGARIIPMQQDPNDHTPNTIENYNEAYGYMARKWGLTLGPVDIPSSRPRDPACPDYYWADHFFAAGKDRDTLLAQFSARFPDLKGCKAEVTPFAALSAVFTVSGDPPQCRR